MKPSLNEGLIMSPNKKEQHWQRVFQLQTESGLTKSEFCKHNQITVSSFYAWAKKLSVQPPKKLNQQNVIPPVLPETTPDQQLTLTVSAQLKGRRVLYQSGG